MIPQWMKTIVEFIHSQKPSIPKEWVWLCSLSSISEMACHSRLRIRYSGQVHPFLNIYTFGFIPSGGGKNVTKTLIETAFFKKQKAVLKLFLDSRRNEIIEQIKLEAISKFPESQDAKERRSWIHEQTLLKARSVGSVACKATPEGFTAERLALSHYGIGSSVIEIDEFARKLKTGTGSDDDFLTYIMEVYEQGENKQKLTKGDATFSVVSGVPATFNAFTTLQALKQNEKQKNALLDYFNSGMMRRSLVCNFKEIKQEQRKITDEELLSQRFGSHKTQESSTSLTQFFADLQSNSLQKPNSFIDIPDEIYLQMVRYELACKEEADNQSNSLKQATLRDKYWRAIRLAGILAFAEGRFIVTDSDWAGAKFLVETYATHAFDVVDELQQVEQIDICHDVFEVLKTTKLNKTEIRKYCPRAWSLRQIDEFIQTLAQTATDNNYQLNVEKGRGLKVTYYATEIPKTEDVKIAYSLKVLQEGQKADIKDPTGFEYVEDTLEGFCVNALSNMYSAFQFKDNYRKIVNNLGGCQLFIYDIDAGLSITEAKTALGDLQYAIIPSKSHLVSKNNVICDRFRIVLPLSEPFKGNESEYKRAYQVLGDTLGLTYDKACNDYARCYFPSGSEHLENLYYSQSDVCINANDYIEDDTDSIERRNVLSVATATPVSGEVGDPEQRLKKAIKTFAGRHYSQGNRNHCLFRMATWLFSQTSDRAWAEQLLQEVTASDPLPSHEYNAVLRSASKKGK